MPTLSPAEAAAEISVSVPTVRRWAEWHAQHLDSTAHPGQGAHRRFTQRDIEVMRSVKELRAQGLSTLSVNERLSGITFATVEGPNLSEAITPAQENRGTTLANAHVVEALTALLAPLTAQQQSQAAKIEELERNKISGLTMFAVGVITSALFFLLVVLLLSLYRG